MAVEAAGVDTSAAVTTNSRPGAIMALILLCIYGGLAVSVDFPRTAVGIQSDEATYYMMAHSLAEDGDLTYHRTDLERVWKEFSSGPIGLFLKRGRDVIDAGTMMSAPFVWYRTQPDPDPTRFYFGKSFIYPLFAAPFVKVFGTNGFLVLHAMLLAGVAWCAFLFLHARSPATPSAVIASGFVMATVVPVYYVWITPELFNFALGFFAYFCWLYKEVAPRDRMPRALQWLGDSRGDLLAAVLLGIATFSKPTNALLFVPLALWYLWNRRIARLLATSVLFVVFAAGLFGINTMITGEWNYQGGERRTFYREFPFQTTTSAFEVGRPMARDEAQADVILQESVFWTNLTNNLKWYFVGRYGGLVAYFFPAVLALVLFLVGARRRPVWQWLVLFGAVTQILLFVITVPYTWLGGGGSVGNRYLMGAYGIFLFLLPPVSSLAVAILPWIVGGIFMAKLVLTPFTTSIAPGTYADAGPLRIFPVELSNLNDLPIVTDRGARIGWFGDDPDRQAGIQDPGFQIYFLDKNAYRENKTFWTRGESRAEFLVKTDRPMKRIIFSVTAGPVATRVRVKLAGRSQDVELTPGETRLVTFALIDGFPYIDRDDRKPRFVWHASVSSSEGFVPLFVEASNDNRFLGAHVKPTLVE
jgi:hypothetical protein